MPWYFPWSESIKKRACRYLLQHYLGDFLKEKLTLDQLTVDLYNGKGTVLDVPLDVWALNDMLECMGLPLQLVDGYIGSISVAVPWTALLNDSCQIEISGLDLTVTPRFKTESGAMFDSASSWNSMSMTTSMQLAQECLKQETAAADADNSSQSFEGLEAFAQTIESVLSRIKVSFVHTAIRLEHIPVHMKTGVGLELHIDRIDFSDTSNNEVFGDSRPLQHTVYEPVAVAVKNLHVVGLALFMDEFPEGKRTRHRVAEQDGDVADSIVHDPNALTPILNDSLQDYMNGGIGQQQQQQQQAPPLLPQAQIVGSCGRHHIKARLKQNEALLGPKFDVEYNLGAINIFLTPRQLHLLLDLVSVFTAGTAPPKDESHAQQRGAMRSMKDDDYKLVEQSLQQQITTSKSVAKAMKSQKVNLQSAFDSFQSTTTTTAPSSLRRVDDLSVGLSSVDCDSEDEFYSMADFSLPALSQPPVLSMDDNDLHPIRTVEQLTDGHTSLSSNLLGAQRKGSLAEQASSVFKVANSGSSGDGLKRLQGVTRHGNSAGLAVLANLDENSEVIRFKVKASNVIVAVLHRDPLSDSIPDQHSLNRGTEHGLIHMSEEFFKHVGRVSMQNMFDDDGVSPRHDLISLCPYDHIRIAMSVVTLEWETETMHAWHSTGIDMVIGKLAIDESLFDLPRMRHHATLAEPYTQTQILRFRSDPDRPNPGNEFSSTPIPSFKLKLQRVTRKKNAALTVQSRSAVQPKSSVVVTLAPLTIEVDVTILDRLNALLKPMPLYAPSVLGQSSARLLTSYMTASLNQQTAFNQAIDDDSPVHCERPMTGIEINCSHGNVLLRFPIPDLRSASDIDKRPWWRKALRQESFSFDIIELKVKLNQGACVKSSSHEISFRSCDGYLSPSPGGDRLHLVSVGCLTSDADAEATHLDWPRIVVTGNADETRSVLEDADRDQGLDPRLDSLEDSYPWMRAAPSPFASKPVMFEAEELVMPGSVAEMEQFQSVALETAKLSINCQFPLLKINLQSRDTFELLYNRLFSDLLMWEPSAPEPCDTHNQTVSPMSTTNSVHINLASHVGLSGGDNFVLCRSAIRDAYDSDSDGEQNSIDDARARDLNRSSGGSRQSAFCFKLTTARGSLALFPSADDVKRSDQTTDATARGHVVVELDDANLCVVTAFSGDELLDYVNLYAAKAVMHHGDVQSNMDVTSMERALSTSSLHRTVFPSHDDVQAKLQDDAQSAAAMLSLSLKMTKSSGSNRKENVLAFGVRGGTLSHRVLPDGQGWLAQVMDFLSVEDSPVLGYTPPVVVTVLHAHLTSCAIDYRPLHLPISTVLAFESFSVSSNIIAGSMTSLLRFIIQDAQVWIGKDRQAYEDLVSVVGVELFELSLRLTDGTDCRQPKLDLNMSNNMVNVRCCSDSCAALLELAMYYASDGDLQETPPLRNETNLTSSRVCEHAPPTASELVLSPTSVPEDMVNSLMADAMLESGGDGKLPSDTVTNEIGDYSSSHSMTSSEHLRRERYFQSTLIDYNRDVDDERDQNSADEYCILETEQDTEEAVDAEPQVQRMIADPIHLIEHHFTVPLGRYDQFSAPFGFPSPVYRYTLREMTIVWQMYGGTDFAVAGATTQSPRQQQHEAEVHSKGRANLRRRRVNDSNRPVRCQGGLGRDLDTLMELHLSKIRFQHEVYPEHAVQSGRDVLLIYDVELRDRCKSSKINKFLYRYSSESVPKQSSANMVSAKVLFTRPEDMVRSEEASVRVSLQPLRFNVDQDSLFFLRDFFTDLSSASWNRDSSAAAVAPNEASSACHEAVLGTSQIEAGINDWDSKMASDVAGEHRERGQHLETMFIRSFVFSPDVPVRFDYHGKRIELDQRTLPALLMGLAHLSCSELTLKRLHCRSGLLGSERLVHYAINEWLDDIRRNQIPGILGGVGPTYSLVQLFQGVRDLFLMPVQQYRQDGRWMRGIQRGAHSFSSSTAMAFLELSNRLVLAVQAAAETAFDMVSPAGAGIGAIRSPTKATQQPADLREGMTNAYSVLSEGIASAAEAIAKAAVDEHERRGVTGAVGGVLRQIPPTVVQPLILATEATSNVLGGALSQLAPDSRREAIEKWKSADS